MGQILKFFNDIYIVTCLILDLLLLDYNQINIFRRKQEARKENRNDIIRITTIHKINSQTFIYRLRGDFIFTITLVVCCTLWEKEI